MIDKINQIVAIIKSAHSKPGNDFSGLELSELSILKSIIGWLESPAHFIDVRGNSFIVGMIRPHEFCNDRIGTVIHFIGGDGNGAELLNEFVQWCDGNEAKLVTISTLFDGDERVEKYFKRKGFEKRGVVLKRGL